ncbi:MAG: ABC transporter substrate-binding protein [Dongiaceae bacterium]
MRPTIRCNRRSLLFATFFAGVVLAMSGGEADAQEAGNVKVVMGTSAPITSIVYLPTVLADRLGFFKEEGIDFTLEQFNGGSAAAAALVNGSVDVLTGNYNHTIQLAAQGKHAVAFAQMTQTPGLVLAISPKATRTIRSIEDLRGANVGVSAPGGGSDILLKYLLGRAGIPASEVPVVSIGLGTTAVAAMEYGKVDAAVMLDPAVSQLKMRVKPAELQILIDLRKPEEVQKQFGVPSVPTASFYTTPEWLAAHPETARKLARALSKSLDWIRAHSAQEMLANLPEDFAGGEPDVYLEALEQNKVGVAQSVRIDEHGAESILEMLTPVLAADAPVDLAKTFTNDYIP